MLLCPTCDEPFVPQYLARCEWCGEQFADGTAPRTALEPPEELNARVLLLLVGLAIVALSAAGYLMYLF